MHLHLLDHRERHFELRAVDEYARHTETERAIEAITGAAGKDGGPCRDVSACRGDDNAVTLLLHARNAFAGAQRRARVERAVREIAIEQFAIDDRRAYTRIVDHERRTVGGDEARGLRHADNRSARETELVEGIEAEHARAVNRRPDPIVLFEHDHAMAACGETTRGQESRGAGADYDDVTIRKPVSVL